MGDGVKIGVLEHKSARSISRRRWIGSGLAACGYLAASHLAAGQSADEPVPPGYTKPGPVTEGGRAPKMQFRIVSVQPNGQRTYALIFGKGDEVLSGLTEFAAREKIVTGYFTGIGALQSALFGWFDSEQKAYRDISVNQQVELISLIGDVGLFNGVPQVHTHCAVGFPDGQMRGGHLLQALVWPTVELFFTAVPVPLVKSFDEETGLELFDLNR